MTRELPPTNVLRRATKEEIPDYEKRWRHNLKVEKAEKKEEWKKFTLLDHFLGTTILFILPILLMWSLGAIGEKIEVKDNGIERREKCIDNRGSYDC